MNFLVGPSADPTDEFTAPTIEPGVEFELRIGYINPPPTRGALDDSAITYTWKKGGEDFHPTILSVDPKGYTRYQIGQRGEDFGTTPFLVTATWEYAGTKYIARRSFFVRPKPDTSVASIPVRIIGNVPAGLDMSAITSADIEVWGYDANGVWAQGAMISADVILTSRQIVGRFNVAPSVAVGFAVNALDKNKFIIYRGVSTGAAWPAGATPDVNMNLASLIQ